MKKFTVIDGVKNLCHTHIQCQEDMADKKYTEKDSRIIKIYNKRLKKYWECSYDAFLKRWGNNGWAIVNK